MVQDHVTFSPLGVSRDLAVTQRQVRRALKAEAIASDLEADPAEDLPIALVEIPQLRTLIQRENQAEVEAARTQHDRPASRTAAQNLHALPLTLLDLYLPAKPYRRPDSNKINFALPKAQYFPPATGAQRRFFRVVQETLVQC